jgi:omega-6 fatty acid desaturase (delta-12 desaturase)
MHNDCSLEEISAETTADEGPRDWKSRLREFEKPQTWRAVRQLLNTLLPYAGAWVAMVWMLRSGLPYWTVLPLIVFAAGLLVRVFIIFHDCCHSSFLPSRSANRLAGYLTGLLAFTPFEAWQHPHNLHHATAGDLDRRGIGDVWTMTVEEYRAAPWHLRARYRIFRHPLVLFVISPTVLFIASYRFWRNGALPKERWSVLKTNLGLAAIITVAAVTMGLKTYLIIQLPVMALTASIGVWLFYVQHQYEEVYWSRHNEWDPARAALEGSSYYKLPRWLEWFTGSVGFHHLHHLRPRIPNYRLRQCSKSLPVEPSRAQLTLLASLKCLRLHLWNEAEKKLVGFRALRT